jgi:hypothetical protein
MPSIGWLGCPSATASEGFAVTCSSVRNRKEGLLLYSLSGRAATSFQGGTLCMEEPIYRTPSRSSGGDSLFYKNCTGAYRIDMNAFAAGATGGDPRPELRELGASVTCQWWARDNGDPHASSLSAALEYHVQP